MLDRRCYRPAAVLAAAILSATAVYAQSDAGSVVGFVKDPSGGLIPSAKIVLKNETTGVERTVTSNESGYYVFTSVPPGFYSLSAEASGFKRYEISHNKLDPNSTLSIDANLTVGSATERVEVIASAQVIQTESASVEKLI